MKNSSLPNIADRIRSGDKGALEQLFREYYQGLCRYAWTLIRNKDASEDIVQDIFLKLWENRRNISYETKWQSYLYSATHHNAMQIIRHENVVLKHEKDIAMHMSTQVDDFNPMLANEMQKTISDTIEALPSPTRDIFCLSRFQGLKYAEIAQQLSISVKTVEAHMGKALKIFRNNLRIYIHN